MIDTVISCSIIVYIQRRNWGCDSAGQGQLVHELGGEIGGHGESMVPDNEDDDRHHDFMWCHCLLNKEGWWCNLERIGLVVHELGQEKGGMGTACRWMMMPTNDATILHGIIVY
jgi:hypothetical protein